jgi:hypothetical protein
MRGLTMLPLVAATVLLASGCDDGMLTAGPTEALAQEAATPTVGTDGRGRGPGLRGMRGAPPLTRILQQREALGLSPEQVARLEALSALFEGEHEALRLQSQAQLGERPERPARGQQSQLTEEQRAALREQMRTRREALRPMMEELRDARREAMAAVREILTDEQEAQLRESRALRPRVPPAR